MTAVVLAVYHLLKGLKKVNYLPGYRVILSPVTVLGRIVPTCFWNLGVNWAWAHRDTAYFNFTHDIISIVPAMFGEATFFTCSFDVMKQLLGNEHKLQLVKPLDLTLHRVWGQSLASASGELWRKHRRAINPAFHSSIYKALRVESGQVYREMIENEGWTDQKEVIIPNIKNVVSKAILVTVGRCGFGLLMKWPRNTRSNIDIDPNQVSLTEAIVISASNVIAKVAIPNWFYKLPIKKVQIVNIAWNMFTSETRKVIRDQKTADLKYDDESEGGYILRRLVAASKEDSGKYLLDEQEMAQTSSSILTATLGFLAIYQDEQETAYKEISEFVSKNGKIDIKEPSDTPHLSGCFFEAGRRYPAGFFLPRSLTEDTPVKVKRPTEQTIILPKGSRIMFDLVSLSNNPNDFPDPHIFRPSRWYNVSDTDLFMFGAGPRMCIGRKFAFMQNVNLLAHILNEWKVDIVPETEDETREAYEKRVMYVAGPDGTSFSVGRVSVKLSKRI
ncbi:hypothetical protein Clacol_003448 [Clathrus columnatus]|uniref:Cytochrome P450 n=1 Tax=Clathrus columnatus TaxID=1419009 RepID=A0AAV5A3I6_9AGAM|nr:hypothetical protein Clacol_003448 [Clathrus columnatus]